VTSQKDEIQALIAEINGVLSKTSPRVPWVMSGGIAEQRHLLERVRTLLVSLQPGLAANETLALARAAQPFPSYNAPYSQAPVPGGATAVGQLPSTEPETAQQLLQAVVQEMSYLRSSLVQPLLTDVDALRHQRDILAQEVKQLEAQKHSLATQPVSSTQQQMLVEFVQALMERWQSSSLGNDPSLAEGDPVQRLQQLQLLQSRTEQMLLTLDSTLNLVFEALDRNVQSYQDSLSKGVERMHGLGQQGELLFTALVNRLAQQLGREASSYLQASLPTTDGTIPAISVPPPLVVPAIDAPVVPDEAVINPVGVAEILEDWGFPYPGTELPQQRLTLEQQQTGEFSNLEDLDLEDLDLSDLNLGEADLNPVDLSDLEALTDSEANLGQSVLFADQSLLNSEAVTRSDDDLDLTLLDTLSTPLQNQGDDMRVEEMDSAMEFLEQLSSSRPDPIAPTILDNVDNEDETILPGFAESELETDPISLESKNPPVDEFYVSLFGSIGLSEALTRFEDDDRDESPLPQDLTQAEVAPSFSESLFSESLFPEAAPIAPVSAPSDDLTLDELNFLDTGRFDTDSEPSENPTIVDLDDDLPLFEEAILGGWPTPNSTDVAGFGLSEDTAIDPANADATLPESPAVLSDDLFAGTEFETTIDPVIEDLAPPESFLAEDLFGDTELTTIDPVIEDLAPPESFLAEDLFGDTELTTIDPVIEEPAPQESFLAEDLFGDTELTTIDPVIEEPAPQESLLAEDLFADLTDTPTAEQTAQLANEQNETTLEMLADFLATASPASLPPKSPQDTQSPQDTLIPPSKKSLEGTVKMRESYRPSPEPPAIDRVPERRAFPRTESAPTTEIQGEDSYIPAAEEENLLVSDEPSGEPDFDLWLNATTLQQLSEDLSNLEGLGSLTAQESDMFRAAEGAESSVASSDLTLERLDSLFSESASPEPPTPNAPQSDRGQGNLSNERANQPRKPEPELPSFGSFRPSTPATKSQDMTLEDLLGGFGDSDAPDSNPGPESEKKNLN